jgi:hypothetical protein
MSRKSYGGQTAQMIAIGRTIEDNIPLFKMHKDGRNILKKQKKILEKEGPLALTESLRSKKRNPFPHIVNHAPGPYNEHFLCGRRTGFSLTHLAMEDFPPTCNNCQKALVYNKKAEREKKVEPTE